VFFDIAWFGAVPLAGCGCAYIYVCILNAILCGMYLVRALHGPDENIPLFPHRKPFVEKMQEFMGPGVFSTALE